MEENFTGVPGFGIDAWKAQKSSIIGTPYIDANATPLVASSPTPGQNTGDGGSKTSSETQKGVASGMALGQGIGDAIGGFFKGAAAKKSYEVAGNIAWLNATNQASVMRFNAQSAAESAGDKEYALYKQQKSRLSSMEAATAANGVALEGSAAEVMAKQAETDAKNRESIISDAKNHQFGLILGASQALQQGRNQKAYYDAMGKAAYKTSVVNGFASLASNSMKAWYWGAN